MNNNYTYNDQVLQWDGENSKKFILIIHTMAMSALEIIEFIESIFVLFYTVVKKKKTILHT